MNGGYVTITGGVGGAGAASDATETDTGCRAWLFSILAHVLDYFPIYFVCFLILTIAVVFCLAVEISERANESRSSYSDPEWEHLRGVSTGPDQIDNLFRCRTPSGWIVISASNDHMIYVPDHDGRWLSRRPPDGGMGWISSESTIFTEE